MLSGDISCCLLLIYAVMRFRVFLPVPANLVRAKPNCQAGLPIRFHLVCSLIYRTAEYTEMVMLNLHCIPLSFGEGNRFSKSSRVELRLPGFGLHNLSSLCLHERHADNQETYKTLLVP